MLHRKAASTKVLTGNRRASVALELDQFESQSDESSDEDGVDNVNTNTQAPALLEEESESESEEDTLPPPPPRQAPRLSIQLEEIQAFYGRYEPAKLPDVDKLVEKYGEDKLLAMVRQKYRQKEENSEFPVRLGFSASAGDATTDQQSLSDGSENNSDTDDEWSGSEDSGRDQVLDLYGLEPDNSEEFSLRDQIDDALSPLVHDTRHIEGLLNAAQLQNFVHPAVQTLSEKLERIEYDEEQRRTPKFEPEVAKAPPPFELKSAVSSIELDRARMDDFFVDTPQSPLTLQDRIDDALSPEFVDTSVMAELLNEAYSVDLRHPSVQTLSEKIERLEMEGGVEKQLQNNRFARASSRSMSMSAEVDGEGGMETGGQISPARSAPNSVPTDPPVVRPLTMGTSRRGSISSPSPSPKSADHLPKSVTRRGSISSPGPSPKASENLRKPVSESKRRGSVSLATKAPDDTLVKSARRASVSIGKPEPSAVGPNAALNNAARRASVSQGGVLFKPDANRLGTGKRRASVAQALIASRRRSVAEELARPDGPGPPGAFTRQQRFPQ
jgi:hypothetical protein